MPNALARLSYAPEARARSPIAKRIWETHESEKFWFGYDVTSVHPTVRTQSHNAIAPLFVRWEDRWEVAWRDAFTTEMLKNTKYEDNLYVFVGYVDKRGKKSKREKKKTEKRGRLAKFNVKESDK